MSGETSSEGEPKRKEMEGNFNNRASLRSTLSAADFKCQTTSGMVNDTGFGEQSYETLVNISNLSGGEPRGSRSRTPSDTMSGVEGQGELNSNNPQVPSAGTVAPGEGQGEEEEALRLKEEMRLREENRLQEDKEEKEKIKKKKEKEHTRRLRREQEKEAEMERIEEETRAEKEFMRKRELEDKQQELKRHEWMKKREETDARERRRGGEGRQGFIFKLG